MYKEAVRAAWTEINLSNADYNIKQIKQKLGDKTKVIGVIKADAYGHGAVKIAEVLRENGIKTFAVATLQECIVLREAGAMEEIIVMGLTPELYAEEIVKYNVTPVVASYDNAKAISEAAEHQGIEIRGLIAADTGMGRIGYMTDSDENIDKAVEEVKKIAELPNFEIRGLISHFSMSEAEDAEYVKLQEERYFRFRDRLLAEGIKLPLETFANSPAVMENSSVYLDAARPGIVLYGYYPSTEIDKSLLDIKPVMSVKANIVYLKEVPEGYSCSYGRKFIAERKSVIGTISIGYADGLPRPYSPYGKVIVNGHIAPIAGNICMDQCMIDLTDVPGVKVGDEVIIMGSDGKNTISADDIAQAVGTINYEILCGFGQRLPKVYVR